MGPTKKQQEAQDRAQEILDKMPAEARAKMEMDNDGNLVVKNRAYRRRKPASDPQYTKKTPKKRTNRKKTYGQDKHNKRST